MRKTERDCSVLARSILQETVGFGRDTTTKEAAYLAGLSKESIYALSKGDMCAAEGLHHLLAIPAFAERYMAARGYDCHHIGNEEGCPYKAAQGVLMAGGEIAPMFHDRSLSHTEQAELSKRIFPKLRRLVTAAIHKMRPRAAGVSAQ